MKEFELSKTSIYYGFIPEILCKKINKEKIKKNFILNKRKNNFQSSSYFEYHQDYLNFQDDKEIFWIYDYVRDKFNLDHNVHLVMKEKSGIVLDKNESIGFHHHIYEKDRENSPTYSLLYTVEKGQKPCYVIFEYSNLFRKQNHCKIEMRENQFILFPSILKHRISKNFNKEPLVNISFRLVQNR